MRHTNYIHLDEDDRAGQYVKHIDGQAPHCALVLGNGSGQGVSFFILDPDQLDDIAAAATEGATALRWALKHYKTVCEEIDASIDAEDIEEARRMV